MPVIVTTGTNLTREWAHDHGFAGEAGFVRKPIELDLLFAGIRRCLS